MASPIHPISILSDSNVLYYPLHSKLSVPESKDLPLSDLYKTVDLAANDMKLYRDLFLSSIIGSSNSMDSTKGLSCVLKWVEALIAITYPFRIKQIGISEKNRGLEYRSSSVSISLEPGEVAEDVLHHLQHELFKNIENVVFSLRSTELNYAQLTWTSEFLKGSKVPLIRNFLTIKQEVEIENSFAFLNKSFQVSPKADQPFGSTTPFEGGILYTEFTPFMIKSFGLSNNNLFSLSPGLQAQYFAIKASLLDIEIDYSCQAQTPDIYQQHKAFYFNKYYSFLLHVFKSYFKISTLTEE